MQPPIPKNSLEAAYQLVADIADILLLHAVPHHQYDPDKFPFPVPTPSRAEITGLDITCLLTPDGEKYEKDPNNASVVPSDLLTRLCDAISELEEIEKSYWGGDKPEYWQEEE